MGEKISPGPQPKRTGDELTRAASEEELGFGLEMEDTLTDYTSYDPTHGQSEHSYLSETLVGADYAKDEAYWHGVKEEIMDGLCQMMFKKSKAELGIEKFNFLNEDLVKMAVSSLEMFKNIEKFYGGMERPKDRADYYIGVASQIKELVLENITVADESVRVVVEVAYGKKHLDLFCKSVRVEK